MAILNLRAGTYTLAEDPVIWYSGGQYHVLYDYPDDRVGYHLTSVDGIHNWTDEDLAYDPRMASTLFSYVGSTTVNQWYKMERPSVLMENGHVTHVTFAVSDVDKNNSIPAGSNHGSKVIVIPFDGATFDADTGVGGSGGAGAGGTSSTGGSSSAGGVKATGGSSTAGGAKATGGSGNATGGVVATGGNVNSAGGSKATGGLAATGGAKATGGTTSASSTGGLSSLAASGGSGNATGGATNASGGAATATGGFINNSGGNGTGGQFSTGGALAAGGMQASGGLIGSTTTSTTDVGTTNTNDSSNVGGCSCRVADGRSHSKSLAMLGVFGLLILRSRKRRTNL